MSIRLAPLGDCVEPIRTWNPATKPDSSFTYVDLSAVDQIEKRITSPIIVRGSEAPSRARQLINKGDVLVSTVRPNLNSVAAVTDVFDGATASTGFCVLRPRSEELSSDYLMHWVRSQQFINHMVREATGASYPAVSDRIIKASHIPLPALDEQQRIATVLDKADVLRHRRKRTIELLDRLLESTFLEMFGDPVSNPKGWPTVLVGAIASKIGSGATPRGGDNAYKASGISFVRSMNVRDEGFSEKGLAFIDSHQAAKLANVSLEADDVLLNITGASVARVCLCPAHILPARVSQHVSIIRPKNNFLSAFLAALLKMPAMKLKLLSVADSGATRQAITKTQIEELLIPAPPQDEILKFKTLAEHLAIMRKLNSKLSQSSDSLFFSLQNRAFLGDLR
ncbi:restriction endonuclease subunit S [Bradyrhizobium sp.]